MYETQREYKRQHLQFFLETLRTMWEEQALPVVGSPVSKFMAWACIIPAATANETPTWAPWVGAGTTGAAAPAIRLRLLRFLLFLKKLSTSLPTAVSSWRVLAIHFLVLFLHARPGLRRLWESSIERSPVMGLTMTSRVGRSSRDNPRRQQRPWQHRLNWQQAWNWSESSKRRHKRAAL